jgi:uncharacterized protein YutE (UPF0331/DUF86 family)
MTDPELIAKKLALIETSVRELQTLGRPELIGKDIREERFVEHTLQIAIQASLDAASHIVSDDRLGEPSSYRELFALLARADYVPRELANELEKMAGFRNVLVHGYEEVDLTIVREIVENRLDDLIRFAECLRSRLPTT